MKDSVFTPNDALLRKYRRMRALCVVLFALLAATVYVNYNYMVFKLIIGANYAHGYTIDMIFEEHLGAHVFTATDDGRFRGHVRFFDYAVMSVFTDAIGDRYTYIYNPGEFQQVQQIVRADAARAEITQISEDTVLMYLPNITPEVRRFVEDNRAKLASFDHLIFDLRGNYGGQLADAYQIADMFLERGEIIANEAGRLPLLNREVRARGTRDFEFDTIIILQNGRTASASESLILALQGNLDNVTTVGQPTFGKAIAQVVVPMRDGFSMRASVMTLSGPNHESIHLTGIVPDIEFSGDASDLPDFALSLID